MTSLDSTAIARLCEGASALGVPLESPHIEGFSRYFEILKTWNARIQLTTVIEPGAVVEKHFLDALSVVPHVRDVTDLVDVGSGGGFPGLVLALMLPDTRITVVESIHKKAAFLEAIKRELRLSRVEVVADRMERLVSAGRVFEAAVSRATFAPEDWVRLGAPLVRPDGRLVAMVVPAAERSVDTFAPDWARTWTRAALHPPYAPGRALLTLEGKRADSTPASQGQPRPGA